jgi:iron complex transport system permease protein
MPRSVAIILLVIFTLAVLAVAPFVGKGVPVSALWASAGDGDASLAIQAEILWKLRMPRVAMAFLAGAGLSVCGMVFQAMFRNPLAEPYTLGIASGASLGAALAIRLGLHLPLAVAGIPLAGLGVSAVGLAAFGGAVGVMSLLYGLTRVRRGFSTATMLLAGVAISFFCSSLILFLQYMSDFTQTFRMLRWVMGGLESVGAVDAWRLFPLVAAGALVVFYLSRELNLLSTGEELAASRGVELGRTKLTLFLASSLMVGAIVAMCGPIGFVGLMAPHICRLLIGPDHRRLMPATLLFGGAFLVLCDTAARTVMEHTELPVGILTALLGGPFFLWLLIGRGPERTGF